MMNYFLLKFAQTIDAGTVNIPKADAGDVITNVLNVVYFLTGSIAVIVIIIAGVMYSSSGGNAGLVTKAKGLLTYSIVGLVVIIVAFAVTNFIRGAI